MKEINSIKEVSRLDVEVGDVLTKNTEPDSRYSVNRIERSADMANPESTTIGLRHLLNGVYSKELTQLSLDMLLREFSIVKRRSGHTVLVGQIREAKKANIKLLHSVQEAIGIFEKSIISDVQREIEASSHIDMPYLSSILGDVIVFRRHGWLARVIYAVDVAGNNYGASVSTSDFISVNGWGFVLISSKNKIKKIVNGVLGRLLKSLNSNEKFNNFDLNHSYVDVDNPDFVSNFSENTTDTNAITTNTQPPN